MLKVFIDTDVAFDLISRREPFYTSSSALAPLSEKGQITLCVSEVSLGNLFYLSYEVYKIKNGTDIMRKFISMCNVLHIGKTMALQALDSDFKDKEDALQYYTALHNECDYFLTRNTKDYKHAVKNLPVLTPDNFSKL